MIVRLTTRQWKHVVASAPSAALETFEVSATSAASKLDVEGPFVAFWRARNALVDAHLSAGRGRKTTTSAAALAAIKNIAREEVATMRHPAFRGIAMRGRQSGWFPAWTHQDQEQFSPMPCEQWRFTVLGPLWIEDRYGLFTIWSERGMKPTAHRLLDEVIHLRAME